MEPTMTMTTATHHLRSYRRAMARQDYETAVCAAIAGRDASSPRGNGWSVWADRLDEAQIGLAATC